jgi:hypothetical protein
MEIIKKEKREKRKEIFLHKQIALRVSQRRGLSNNKNTQKITEIKAVYIYRFMSFS